MEAVFHGPHQGGCKILITPGFAASAGDEDDDYFRCLYCVDKKRYCLSLSRRRDDDLVEVMVLDQINFKTNQIEVTLFRNALRLRLSQEAANQLDGVTEYIVILEEPDDEMDCLNAILLLIFEGGFRGRYEANLSTNLAF